MLRIESQIFTPSSVGESETARRDCRWTKTWIASDQHADPVAPASDMSLTFRTLVTLRVILSTREVEQGIGGV